ncbi:unnamed protein product [Phaedon cochleariae]|uniref:Piezo-type mechanosensitive ion channel component n=1 Tax=Phaedon cochleariae TaxID=80249 RepID=A0A9P0DS56_PHACE|nr:unnamed protein product [Phaedon cochleariae]
MGNYILSTILFRLLLPAVISVCIIFRPSGLSAIYLLVLCYLPFVPVPTEKTLNGHTGIFFKIFLVISVLTPISQLAFQVFLLLKPPYAHLLKDDPFLEKILRHAGFVRLDGLAAAIAFLWLSPEVVFLAAAIAFYVTAKKLNAPLPITVEESSVMAVDVDTPKQKKTSSQTFLVALGRYCVLTTLCLAAVMRPSVQGGLYFLVFLSAATWWACYRPLRKCFAIVLCCLVPIVFIHIWTLYAYQLPWSQEFLPKRSPYARYFGLTQLVKIRDNDTTVDLFDNGDSNGTIVDESDHNITDVMTLLSTTLSPLSSTLVSDEREYVFSKTEEWASFVNPIILYILYYILILESKELLKPELAQKQGTFSRLEGSFTGDLSRQMSQRLSKQQLIRSTTTKKKWQSATRKVRINLEPDIRQTEPTENTPLIRGVSPSKKRAGSGKRSGIFQDSTGSATVTGEGEEIPLDEFDEGQALEISLFENVMYGLESILQLIVRSSYIATNIIMMAWSITYLSWITFVLLIWANLIWLVPKQRKNMLHSSPFLVLYAWFLLISAYIFSMNLTNDELPAELEGFNLKEIGFERVGNLPCLPLIVKCLYTVMFWVTLRQYMQERMEARQKSALADMVAPLQVTVGTAAGVEKGQEKTGNKTLERFGRLMKRFLTKCWIWVVATTLFAVAITGQRMTGFRIVYMALFIFFILSFQFSFRVWRKLMFAFLLTVIIYSMIILVLIYTYQFKEFPLYWKEYIHLPIEQQKDMGLEQFETKLLFVRLVTPTFFVIVTVIQLHYIHDDFMALSDPKNTSEIADDDNDAEDLEQSSMQGGAFIDRSQKDDSFSSANYDLYELGNFSSLQFQHLAQSWLKKLYRLKNLTFRFLELHMSKVVLLFAMLMCIHDKCAVYMVIVILISMAFTFGRPVQLFAIYLSSLLVSVLLLARMIYQIKYITPKNWNVNCTVSDNPDMNETTVNIFPWLGFHKAENSEKSLAGLLKWNIIYILVVTLWSVILVRQYNYRMSRGRPTTRAFFMFPTITRDDADKSLTHFSKYMANYGFYKFGVEISLIMTVVVIGARFDAYSVLYGIWLCTLFSLGRKTLSRIWVFYLIFIAVALPFQYFMAVGLPPPLCQEFPWDHPILFMKGLQDWAFLPDIYNPPPVEKLIYDFLLLVIVSRQWVVFRIEKRYEHSNYAGGSNGSIIHHAEEQDFVNPVPDFITYTRSYLDVLKKLVLQSFLWITLAIVFLAGTNRVNIFSIGYLLGAFVFLWHGSDFYLRPIPKILRQWQMLLGFNVTVIFIKCWFQLIGCVFLHNIPISCCWLVQLLGIGCDKKFGVDEDVVDETVPERCMVPEEYMGMAWDGVCFCLLVLQRRIFNSYNFFHIVDDTKATTILASRGAELIEEIRLKAMKEQDDIEHKVLEKIKMKMDRIKANQQKIQDSIYSGRPKYRVKQPITYKEAIRSGDYYMFDELEDEEIDLLPEEKAVEEEDRLRRPDMGEIDENEPRNVRIQELKEDDGQPGTSKDEDFSEFTDVEPNIWRKILSWLIFIWAFVESAMVSMTRFLNRHSSNYRYVLRVLAKEKRTLKEKTHYNIGLRVGPGKIWQPAGSYHSLLRHSVRTSVNPEITRMSLDYGEEMSSYDQPTIFRLLLAVWYIIMSKSDVLCYFVIFLNQIKNANFICLPLPFMVFFWGTLTIPRPSKTFWVTIIAYTEVIVLLKCLFQFDIMPGNQRRTVTEYKTTISETNPFYPPTIIGLHRSNNYYAMWDLFLLLVVFFHRVLLKSMGIWSSTGPTTAALLEDGEYRLKDGEFVPVTASSPPSTSSKKSSKSTRSSRASKSRSSTPVSEEETILIRTRPMQKMRHISIAMKMAMAKYAQHFKIFIQNLLDPTSRTAADVYSLMFLCDFINFFVVLFGYSSFGSQQEGGGVADYLQENRVPALFLFMLIFQFMLIIIDRGIYLRKNILGKIIFQFIQIILLHVWLFILFPVITGNQCNKVLAPQIYYMVKCFYLLFSAFQIRCGYPTRILGNFLCKGYGYLNMFLYKGFMLIPFLFELRTCMDWMWTETSMTLFDWIKMEDIFSHIFLLKCSRHVEDEYPQPRGEKKKGHIKYLMGGAVLVVIIGIIWFPLVFFSLGNTVGEPNPPTDVTLEIRIGPYEPIYKMSAQSNSIDQFTSGEMEMLMTLYNAYKISETFIYNYEAVDVAAVKLSSDSANIWAISPPDRKRMVAEIESPRPLEIRLFYKVSHKTSKPEDSGIISDFVERVIPPSTEMENNTIRQNLLKMLEGGEADPVQFTFLLPKFLKVTNRGTAKPIDELMLAHPKKLSKEFRNITISLLRPNNSLLHEGEWWQIHEECGTPDDKNYEVFLKKIPYEDCKNYIVMYTFNDKVFPSTLDFITGGGIIGLYTTLVFLASRVLRGFFADGCAKIMFEDLPNVDRVLQLCLDIYLVREAYEFCLEEDLFAKLVFLFRSPETLIKWTRPKEEVADDDDPEGDGE